MGNYPPEFRISSNKKAIPTKHHKLSQSFETSSVFMKTESTKKIPEGVVTLGAKKMSGMTDVLKYDTLRKHKNSSVSKISKKSESLRHKLQNVRRQEAAIQAQLKKHE